MEPAKPEATTDEKLVMDENMLAKLLGEVYN
jgi:hypothetical protein